LGSYTDYRNIENSVIKGDIIAFAKRLGTRTGLAHTDLFAFAKKRPEGVKRYLESLAKANVFWELNVNYDSIHGYREHAYVKRFFESEEEQNLVKEVGLAISVGFDGHRMEDYDVSRVKSACEFLENGKFNFIGNYYKEI
jgi:histidinol phosphatase-like PHP family hydrolase